MKLKKSTLLGFALKKSRLLSVHVMRCSHNVSAQSVVCRSVASIQKE